MSRLITHVRPLLRIAVPVTVSTALIAVALVLLAFGIAYLVPKTRAKLHGFRETLRKQWTDAKEALLVLRHPKKVVLLLGGNLIAQVMLAIILGVCLHAFGHSASLAALIDDDPRTEGVVFPTQRAGHSIQLELADTPRKLMLAMRTPLSAAAVSAAAIKL